MPNVERQFKALGKLLDLIQQSGVSEREVRNLLVKYTSTNAILLLVDVLDDLLSKEKLNG